MPMPALPDFNDGDTDYVQKLDTLCTVLTATINALLDRTANRPETTSILAHAAIFGTQAALVGKESLVATIDGGDAAKLNYTTGYAYRASNKTIAQITIASSLDFGGNAADTYYVRPTADGSALFFTDSGSVDDLYSVTFDGTEITAITRLARVTWGAWDWHEAGDSDYFGTRYYSLRDRLDAIEANFLWSPTIQPTDGVLSNGQEFFRAVALSPVDIAEDFEGAVWKLKVAATDGNWIATVKKRTAAGVVSTVGTITIADGTTDDTTFSCSAFSLARGDELIAVGPNPASADAEGPYGGFVGRRGYQAP